MSNCIHPFQPPARCCAAAMASILEGAASVTAGGKVLSAMCLPTSALTSTAEDMVSATLVPAPVILVIRVITVKKVRMTSADLWTYVITMAMSCDLS